MDTETYQTYLYDDDHSFYNVSVSYYPGYSDYGDDVVMTTRDIAEISVSLGLAILTVVFNLGTMATILCRKMLRRSPKYMMVTVLAFLDLIVGAVVLPIRIITLFNASWFLSCESRYVLHFLESTFQRSSFVCILTCLNIVVILVGLMSSCMVGKKGKIIALLMSFFSIIYSLLVLAPIYGTGLQPIDDTLSTQHRCLFVINTKHSLALLILSDLVPIFVLLITTFCNFCSSIMSSGQVVNEKNQRHVDPRAQIHLDALLVSFVTILLLLPLPVFLLVLHFVPGICDEHDCMVELVQYFALFKSCVVPLCWLCNRDFRNGVVSLITCRCFCK